RLAQGTPSPSGASRQTCTTRRTSWPTRRRTITARSSGSTTTRACSSASIPTARATTPATTAPRRSRARRRSARIPTTRSTDSRLPRSTARAAAPSRPSTCCSASTGIDLRTHHMRTWSALLAFLGLAASTAPAQTIPSSIANSLFQVSEDDGAAETSFKLWSPTPAGEYYNVDFNTDAAGMTVLGVAVELYVSAGSAQISQVAVCGDNLALDPSGRTPDLASPLSSLTNP